MHPIIWRITGNLGIKSYGIAIAAAFLVAIYLSARKAKGMGFSFNHFVDMGFWIIVSAIVGSRVFYILFHLRTYLEHPLAVLKVWQGGLIFYGGLLFAVAASFIFMKVKKIPVWLGSDIVAPNVALGYAITRVGCFLNGCCFGKPTALPWGVKFPFGCAAGEFSADYLSRQLFLGRPVGDVLLHPAQLYAALINLGIFIFLTVWWRRRRFDGEIFWTYLGLYGIYRFGIEFLRSDNLHLLWGLTAPQLMSAALVVITIVAWWHLRRRGILTTTTPAEYQPAK